MHFDTVIGLKLEPHLNTLFRHFVLFSHSFGLLEKKVFAYGPVSELVKRFLSPNKNHLSSGNIISSQFPVPSHQA